MSKVVIDTNVIISAGISTLIVMSGTGDVVVFFTTIKQLITWSPETLIFFDKFKVLSLTPQKTDASIMPRGVPMVPVGGITT